jgi:hypothetical protein
MQTVKIGFLSEDYFALAASRTELGAAFALGSRVIALSDGVAYEVVEDASTVTTPLEIPPTRTPESSEAASHTPASVTPQSSLATAVEPTEQPASTTTPGRGFIPSCGASLIPLVVLLPGVAVLLSRKKK